MYHEKNLTLEISKTKKLYQIRKATAFPRQKCTFGKRSATHNSYSRNLINIDYKHLSNVVRVTSKDTFRINMKITFVHFDKICSYSIVFGHTHIYQHIFLKLTLLTYELHHMLPFSSKFISDSWTTFLNVGPCNNYFGKRNKQRTTWFAIKISPTVKSAITASCAHRFFQLNTYVSWFCDSRSCWPSSNSNISKKYNILSIVLNVLSP